MGKGSFRWPDISASCRLPSLRDVKDASMADITSATAPSAEPNVRSALLTAEKVNTLAHYYRGEISRMISWRERIDRTSNWAIAAAAAMLSLSLSTPTAHHGVLLFAMVLVLLLHLIEARRYRYYDVDRDRVRLLEQHYLAPMLTEGHHGNPDWIAALAESLKQPRFSVSRIGAISRRLRRNYGWMYLILLFAWALKILSARLQPEGVVASWREPLANAALSAALGPIPGWAVLVAVALFYGAIAWVALQPDRGQNSDAGEVYF
jgi:uncharacterized membrane protein